MLFSDAKKWLVVINDREFIIYAKDRAQAKRRHKKLLDGKGDGPTLITKELPVTIIERWWDFDSGKKKGSE